MTFACKHIIKNTLIILRFYMKRTFHMGIQNGMILLLLYAAGKYNFIHVTKHCSHKYHNFYKISSESFSKLNIAFNLKRLYNIVRALQCKHV